MSDETRAVRTIGRYHAVDELGRGAMGIVYRGFDPVIGRTVALKTIGITAEGAEAKTLRERLYREASAAGTLTHPNIVTIYDVIEDGATTAVAMEFVEGRTLADLLEQDGPLPVDRALELFEQIVSALDYAGSKGIVHRDVKPANILLTAEGRAKVTDFGIARVAVSGLTQTGTIMGSPSYMSPEQIRGVPLDPRSDLFSAAVVLFEMLTGRRPFGGDDVATTMYRIVNEPPPAIEQINSSIHPAVSAVLARALAKDPQQRFQTGAELVAELKRSLGQGPPSLSMSVPLPAYVPETTQAPQPSRRPMGLIIGGVAVVVIVVAVIGIVFSGGGTTSAPTATQTASGIEIATREVQPPAAPPADAARTSSTGPISTVPPPPTNVPAATIPPPTGRAQAQPPTRLTGPVSTMPPLVLNEPAAATPPAGAGAGTGGRAEVKGTPPTSDTTVRARPPDLPPARTPPQRDPEPPARPPDPPAAGDATVRVDFDGTAYAVTLMAGDERLGRVDAEGQAVSVEPGTVRLRAINEALFLNLDLGTVTLRAGERKTVVIPGTASAVFNVKGEDYTGVRIFIDGRQVPGPYPAQIAQIAAGPHAVVYRWTSGPMAGREITKTVTLGARGHFLVRAVIDNGDILVQQLR